MARFILEIAIDKALANVTSERLMRISSLVIDNFEVNLLPQTVKIFSDEYSKQFSSQGSYFGKPWGKSLSKSGGFEASFRPESESLIFNRVGRDNFTFRIRNRYKPPRYGARIPLVALFQSGYSTAKRRNIGGRKRKFKSTKVQFNIVGPIGGISQAGVSQLHSVWEETISSIIRTVFGR